MFFCAYILNFSKGSEIGWKQLLDERICRTENLKLKLSGNFKSQTDSNLFNPHQKAN